MHNCKTVTTPSIDNCAQEIVSFKPVDKKDYQDRVGYVLFISTLSSPDKSFAVNKMTRSCSDPTMLDWIGAKVVLQYLKGTIYFGLRLGTSYTQLQAYSDADLDRHQKDLW